ncbi:MAG: chromosomal replication initiator protein DnaA [Bacteroidota bacterium]
MERTLPDETTKTHISVWDNCLRLIKSRVEPSDLRTWFMPIQPLRVEGSTLTIQVPSEFFYEWLEQHYVDLLSEAIRQELGPRGGLEYSIIMDSGNGKSKPIGISIPANNGTANSGGYNRSTGGYANGNGSNNGNGNSRNAAPASGPIRSPFEDRRDLDRNMLDENQLNASHTFENYIEGACNRLARSAGMAVANKPGHTIFNPLMVYGGVGLGKTHLLHAIGNRIRQTQPDKFILYVNTQKFTDQFIDAVRTETIRDFNDFYMRVDVLLLDDIQFLANRTQTQEILFTIFNHLHQRNRQLVLTSDCPPAELNGLTERLKSRFKWGLVADLSMPDFETRVAIIQNKMAREGIEIPINVVEYLANTVDTNIRELEGVMVSLIAQTSLNGRAYDLDLAKQIIRNIVQNIEPEMDIDYIQKAVSDYFNVPQDQLKAKTRKSEIVVARQVAMFFAKEFTGFSLESIGKSFGGRHHSTVIYAIQAVSEMMDTDLQFKSSIQELQKRMKVK